VWDPIEHPVLFRVQQESSPAWNSPGVQNKTGISIDYQNPDDLFSLMRVVFINNSGDQYSKVNEQVRYMNTKVIATAMSQIQTGVSQYIAYAEDIDTISTPMDRPVNTSTMGKKIDFNNKIGIN